MSAPSASPPDRADTNSKRSRVEPIFSWLRDNAGEHWPSRFVELAEGLRVRIETRALKKLDCEKEVRVPPSPERLAWMIRNAERLAPVEGRRWREYKRRILDNPQRFEALETLDRGAASGIDRDLILEGPSYADCLIECETAVIWVEGKRNDWLAPSTSWDVTRDQLARNLEAVSRLAGTDKDFCLIICHEHGLKHHEELLLDGYRAGTWTAGWPHLDPDTREHLSARIGTLRWRSIAGEWPEMRSLPVLADLED